MEALLTGEVWIALLTLTFLEIVLGVDNIIFISIVANRLPTEKHNKAHNIGLAIAMGFRIVLIFGIMWIISFKEPLFTVLNVGIGIRDIILMIGGLFLLGKSVTEIHEKMEGGEHSKQTESPTGFWSVIFQITALNIVFSFDSILTAVGLVDLTGTNYPADGSKYPDEIGIGIMIIAVIASMIVMMLFAGGISRFISKHPTLEVLALSFLILIGFMLVLEGVHIEIPKGYIYFAVFFALIVEVVNLRVRKVNKPIKLYNTEIE